MREIRNIPSGFIRAAALALLLCFFVLPARTAASAPLPALFESAGSGAAGPAFMAMGGRDEAALAPRGGGEESVTEQIFGGSYLGALFFGLPATGFGGADLVALAVLAYLLLRSVGGRKASRDQDRFTVHRGGLDRTGRDEDDRDGFDRDDEDSDSSSSLGGRYGQRDVPRRREDDPAPSGDPRDNPWSRKLRGGGSASSGGGSAFGRGEPSGRAGKGGSFGGDRGNGGPFGGDGRNGGPFGGKEQQNRPRPTMRDRAESMWGHLSSEQPGQSGQPEKAPVGAVAEGARIPAGFDVNDFLDGARTLYVRLQNAWASRQVEDLAPFVADSLMSMLRAQAAANPEPSPVDIVLVNATLQDVRSGGEGQSAEVHFDVLMKTADETQPSEVRELWTFVRSGASGGMWRLTGIAAA